ncbi:ER lumen protein retaining receptor isoform 2 [Theobroma cacao]|uniref:ER lumen protein-retaining receptor n=1 Tax=Theobroma cacao TaxID=3641 RepID=A0A061DP88_THECC|nr:ER lumen protein retaining receptor isoform 2 [Theobroma cacao]
MNIFRLAGDMTHLASVLVLLLKIHTIKSCAGISLKTQELYAIVFASRYLDIFTDFISLYNTSMKLIFLGSSFSIVWYMRRHKIVRRSYDKDQDTFRHYFLLLPCLLLALLFNEKFTFKEVMWTFSLYLEAVAILPQLVLLQRTRNIDNLTGQYVFLLGAYRGLYILNWIYRYFTEPHYVHWIHKVVIMELPWQTSLASSWLCWLSKATEHIRLVPSLTFSRGFYVYLIPDLLVYLRCNNFWKDFPACRSDCIF